MLKVRKCDETKTKSQTHNQLQQRILNSNPCQEVRGYGTHKLGHAAGLANTQVPSRRAKSPLFITGWRPAKILLLSEMRLDRGQNKRQPLAIA